MKIDFEMIQKIFNRKIELKNEKDKIALSNYSEYIPMYDIFTQTIKAVPKDKLYNSLIYQHYRFVNEEIYNWIVLLIEKYEKKIPNNAPTTVELKRCNAVDSLKPGPMTISAVTGTFTDATSPSRIALATTALMSTVNPITKKPE